jgi:hypothetical protein
MRMKSCTAFSETNSHRCTDLWYHWKDARPHLPPVIRHDLALEDLLSMGVSMLVVANNTPRHFALFEDVERGVDLIEAVRAADQFVEFKLLG